MTIRDPKYEIGHESVVLVTKMLRARGWYIIPTEDFCGRDGEHAPMASAAMERIILPDLDIAMRGLRMWAEVKEKARPTFTILTGTSDHGMGLRKFRAYCHLQREYGSHIWIFLVELSSQMVLIESLDHLTTTSAARQYTGDKMDIGGMIFWPRSVFRTRIQFNEIPGLFDLEIPLPFERRRA
jgi:hypothetical protein